MHHWGHQAPLSTPQDVSTDTTSPMKQAGPASPFLYTDEDSEVPGGAVTCPARPPASQGYSRA